jgi:hypothetical protein
MMQELLNMEQFCKKIQQNLNQIFLGETKVCSWYRKKSPWLVRFLEGDFVTLRPMLQDIMNFENHLEREISLATSSHMD